jgi:hypothetical protein
LDGDGRRRGCLPSGASSRDWRIPVGAPLQRANVGTRRLIPPLNSPSPLSVHLSVGCGPAPLWGALWGLHGDCGSYVCSSDSSCTAASCLPPPEEEEAECGGVLPIKHTQGPGFDLSQAPPTSRVCLSAFKPAYSSPHTLVVPKLNAISPHFAASKPPACRTQPPV